MRMLLDGHDHRTDAVTLADALREAADVAERNGRMVVEVLVDGHRLDDSQLRDGATLGAAVEAVELVTADPDLLVRETFVNAADAVVEADRLQRTAAEAFQADRAPDGLPALREALDVWTQVREATTSGIAFRGIDTSALSVDGSSFEELVESLRARLSDVHDAVSAGDTTALADILLYEFPETSKAWAVLLRSLAEGIPGANGGDA